VPPSEELARLVRAAQSEHRLPGVSVAVVVRGDRVLDLALGVADAEAGRDATPDTQYRVGSITKTFTAASILALVEEGKVSLDDPLGKHVAAAGDRPLTIGRLLSHASGLQREPVGAVWETFDFPTTEKLLASLDEAEQVLEPGAHWHYSNLAYALLGEVVAQASSMPYQRFVDERLIGPLDLGRTTWERTDPAARGYFVDPYSGVLRPEVEITRSGGVSAAGDLWSTVGDLCRWGAWLGEREPMHAVQIMAEPNRWLLAWGLGLMLHRRGERILYGHDGAMPGFLASLACSRSDDVQACVLTNASTPAPAVTELALSLAERALELVPRDPDLWRPEEPPPAELEGVLGTWWSEGTEFVFRWHGGKLEAALVSGSARAEPSVFEQEAPDRFRVASGRERGEALEIVRDEKSEVVKLYLATYPFTRSPECSGRPNGCPRRSRQ
jgi:CubicO group peptidase (beta-lactamase class C family)